VHVVASGQAAPLLLPDVVSHVTPHAPQLLVVVSLTHVPLQSTWPVGHLHTPAWHVELPGHTFPQDPQLLLSVCSLTQALPQTEKPALQPKAHA
jgi:hypothetical protein